jgi:phenylalanine-4-hydroxylase
MRGTHSPRALARIIWLRRTEKGLVERNPVLSAWRSVSVSSRTKIGFLLQNNIPLSRLSVSGSH